MKGVFSLDTNRYSSRRYPSSYDRDRMVRVENHNETERKMPLGISYVPWQEFSKMYEPMKALERGTAFPELDFPFCGIRGGCS